MNYNFLETLNQKKKKNKTFIKEAGANMKHLLRHTLGTHLASGNAIMTGDIHKLLLNNKQQYNNNSQSNSTMGLGNSGQKKSATNFL